MASRSQQISPSQKVASTLFATWSVILLAAWYGYPFFYCSIWQPYVWRPLLQPYASLALLFMSAYWFYACVRYGLMSGTSAGALLMMFVIGNFDGWARILLAFGRSCQ